MTLGGAEMPLKKNPSILMADICIRVGLLRFFVRKNELYRPFGSYNHFINYSRIKVT